MEDYEEVFPDKVLGHDGSPKENPIHIFVPEVLKRTKIVTKEFEPTGLEGLLSMMSPPYTHHNQELRNRQIIAAMAAGPMRYYRFIVDQVGACPTLMLASRESSTMKTATAVLCQKMFSQQTIMAPGSSQASIDLAKAISSNTVFVDDLEQPNTRHKLIMDGYNGASKTTIERGEEVKLAGQIISFNITNSDRMMPKEDEGRTLLHHFPSLNEERDFEESFENQVEHNEAMKSKGAPHDFHAYFGAKNFSREPGERSNWQVIQRYQHVVAFVFLHCVFSNVLLDCLPGHIGCTCLTFLHCVLSSVSLNRLSENMYSCICCIYLSFLHCVLLSVSSENLH